MSGDTPLVAPFRVKLWCRDCTGSDPLGCFDGGTSFIFDGWEPRLFATLDEATKAGHEETSGPPWEFDVLDALDRAVFKSVE